MLDRRSGSESREIYGCILPAVLPSVPPKHDRGRICRTLSKAEVVDPSLPQGPHGSRQHDAPVVGERPYETRRSRGSSGRGGVKAAGYPQETRVECLALRAAAIIRMSTRRAGTSVRMSFHPARGSCSVHGPHPNLAPNLEGTAWGGKKSLPPEPDPISISRNPDDQSLSPYRNAIFSRPRRLRHGETW